MHAWLAYIKSRRSATPPERASMRASVTLLTVFFAPLLIAGDDECECKVLYQLVNIACFAYRLNMCFTIPQLCEIVEF